MGKQSKRRMGALAGAALVLAPLAAAGGWIAYSRLFVEHDVPLPKAIDARHGTRGTRHGRVNYYVDDSAEGRPLVLIHSINAAASAYEMRPLFEYYRGQRPVYALELPGFGLSDRPNIVYTPEVFKEAILDFVGSMFDVPVDVVTLSLSGEFAALAAQEEPPRFNSLTLISPTGFAASSEQSRSNRAGESGQSSALYRAFTFPFDGRALFDLIATRPSILYFLKKSFKGTPDEGLVQYSYKSSHQPGAHHAPLYFVSGQLFTPDIREQVYAKLSTPVLVIYDEDAYTSFDLLPRFMEHHQNWMASRVRPTRGLPQFEQLSKTVDALDAFWQNV